MYYVAQCSKRIYLVRLPLTHCTCVLFLATSCLLYTDTVPLINSHKYNTPHVILSSSKKTSSFLNFRPCFIDSLYPSASSPSYRIQNYYWISVLWISLTCHTNPQITPIPAHALQGPGVTSTTLHDGRAGAFLLWKVTARVVVCYVYHRASYSLLGHAVKYKRLSLWRCQQ